MPETSWSAALRLAGGGGEPVDLWRSIQSHGLVDLPPMRIDEQARTLEITVPLCLVALVAPRLLEREGRPVVLVAGVAAAATTTLPAGSGLIVAVAAGLAAALVRRGEWS